MLCVFKFNFVKSGKTEEKISNIKQKHLDKFKRDVVFLLSLFGCCCYCCSFYWRLLCILHKENICMGRMLPGTSREWVVSGVKIIWFWINYVNFWCLLICYCCEWNHRNVLWSWFACLGLNFNAINSLLMSVILKVWEGFT